MRILDLTAGNRAIWFDRENPLATFVDVRPEVKPTVVADSSALPDSIGTGFDLVVFDPPHKQNGAQFGMSRSYGSWGSEEITQLVTGAAREAHRVTKPGALMAFKWNDHARKLATALRMLEPYWLPLFGHGLRPQQRGKSQTSWMLLLRQEANCRAQ